MKNIIKISGFDYLYMSRDGSVKIELLESATWGYFEWGILKDCDFDIDKILEKYNLELIG